VDRGGGRYGHEPPPVNASVGNTCALGLAWGAWLHPLMAAFTAKELGARVREARQRAGLTQAALAEAAGVTDETVSRLERGAYEPSLSTVLALAAALGTDVASLASGAAQAGPPLTSPLLRRLHAQLERLDVPAQSALLRIAELLAERGASREGHVLKAAESGAPYARARRPRRKP
jgi:transcriptional regulator with XRE-family HTH domain